MLRPINGTEQSVTLKRLHRSIQNIQQGLHGRAQRLVSVSSRQLFSQVVAINTSYFSFFDLEDNQIQSVESGFSYIVVVVMRNSNLLLRV